MPRMIVMGRDLQRDAPAPDLGALGELGGAARNVKTVQVGAIRAADQRQELDDLSHDSIVELTLDNGARFWLSYQQLADDLPRSVVRGPAGAPDAIELPPVLIGSATRGSLADGAIETVRTFDIDLAGILGEAAGKVTGPLLATKLDDWRMKNPGLRRWNPSVLLAPDSPIVKAGELTGSGPWLVMIHGTGSSTNGSFGGLGQVGAAAADAWRSTAVDTLQRAYRDRMVALEHKTLSVSPIDNAIDLVEALPEGATLHVVSHSRGGQIGELLCRAQRLDGKAPFEGEIEGLKRWIEGKEARYGAELAKLAKLNELLKAKRLKVERFVRVACPAAGTTLASQRLDRWLSMATNVLDLTGLSASNTYRFTKGFLLAVVKTRTDPHDVPGLEAMLPGSLLTIVLNRPGIETAADLSVISGDVQGESLMGRLAIKAVHWYYGGENDLIVDTVSMYGGAARQGGARFFFDQGNDVNHFAYFRNRKTAERLVAALRRQDGDQAGFARLERPQEIDEFLSGRREAARPTAFLVPGLMGSHLARQKDSPQKDSPQKERLWIDLARIAQGDFPDAGDLVAEALVADAYGELVKHLSGSHRVEPFAYDWRQSLRETGAKFADALATRMKASKEPVRIVAHSSGALVVSAAFAAQRKLWEDFAARAGSRVLLLGAPSRGSHAVARLLLGEDRLIKYLGLLDFNRREEEFAALFARFPGVLELLPEGPGVDLLDAGSWQRIRAARAGNRPPPDAAALAEAKKTRELLKSAPTDKSRILHVVGTAAATPIGLDTADGEIRFIGGSRGDGRVPWPSTTGSDLAIWWADAEHGELARHVPAFGAYVELLERGTTRVLPQQSPDVAERTFELPADDAPVYPDAAELAAAALGYQRRRLRAPQARTVLRVVHGNLAFARWPFTVGHYDGDTLSGSELHLDRTLGGRLSERRDLRLYPDRIQTSEIILDPERSPPGAVVVGLGTVGELTQGELRRTLGYAFRRYVLAMREQSRALDAIGISVLAIGAGEGGIGIRDSVMALLEAVALANAALGRQKSAAPTGAAVQAGDGPARLSSVEIMELYEDRAIQLAHAIELALKSERLKALFDFDGLVKVGDGGRRRPTAQEDPSWWRRLRINQTKQGELKFTDLTDRARAEVTLVADQRNVVDRFVRRAVGYTTLGPNGISPGATLFELLLPTRLKETAHNDRNVVLVLDDETAHYPWELLRQGTADEEEPLAVRAGMIRQLIEPQFRDRPIMATEDKALVIGNPPSGMADFPPLPGAEDEANLVVSLLGPDFQVTSRIGKDADPDDVISTLMADRWRVLHLAGHGDVGYSKDGSAPVTGMVLGQDIFLTPGLIGQLSAVPEFVFINCCHLGRVDEAAEKKAARRFHELAANLATQFIKLGTRAVVAAGWAVDDAAAKMFAERLYGYMLGGLLFGEAVKRARSDVYQAHRATNTWGAYQCYGDPAYRLMRHPRRRVATAELPKYVHLREAIIDLENITQDSQTQAVRDPAVLGERLEAIWKAVWSEIPSERTAPIAWAKNPDLLTAAGQAAAELLQLDRAIDCYQQALQAERATASVRSVEQLANLLARRAAIANDPAAANVIRDSIVLIERLGVLTAPSAGGGEPKPRRGERRRPTEEAARDQQTVERLSILGSCYKRLAQVSAGKDRKDALESMSKHYYAALDRGKASGLNRYPLLNWLLAETLLAALDPTRKAPEGINEWLVRAETTLVPADGREPDIWDALGVGDVALARFLLSDTDMPAREAEMIEAYLKPWRRGASPLKFASVVENLDFIAAVLDELWSEPRAQRLTTALQAAARRLREETGVKMPAPATPSGAAG